MQFPPEFIEHLIDIVIDALDGAMDKLLESGDLAEIVHKLPIIIRVAQVVTDFIHLVAEELAVHLLGKLEEATAVLKEAPTLFLGITTHLVALILLHPLVHLSRLAFLPQGEQEVVYRHPHGILLLKLDIIVEITVQLTGEVTQDGLEKRVNRAHIEVAVIKQQLVQGLARQRPYLFLTQARLADKAIQIIALGTRQGQIIQFGDDAFFHLVGGLVGKCNGQQLTMGVEDALIARSTSGHKAAALTSGEKQLLDVL